MDWRANIINSDSGVRQLLRRVRRVAVLGIRSERFPNRPAYYVPASLARAGLTIVPVPVHERELTHILGQPAYHTLADIPGDIDLVDVFRRAEDIPQHLDDLLAKHPHAVWFQSGIRNNAVAETLAQAGIKVVQDRCLMIDYGMLRKAG